MNPKRPLPCFTDFVRSTCRQVAESASRVHLRPERIAAYGRSLLAENPPPPVLDPARHYLGHDQDTVAFILTLNSINFGSGYFPHLKKRPGCSGYFTVASALTDRFRSRGPLSAEELKELTPLDCARIFGQDISDEAIGELMGLFAGALNDLGRLLLKKFHGSLLGLTGAANGSVEALIGLLAEMPAFNDREVYRGGLTVHFYKRAQLAAADLALAFDRKGPGRFDDLDRLTIFADNLVPHVLRVDGILEYEKPLAERIDSGELIPAGSEEEIELRAGAVHAVELIAASLRSSAQPAGAMELDYILWNRGQKPYYKSRPRHRTRTVFY